MQVLKKENPELLERHIRFFEAVGNSSLNVIQLEPDIYLYRFVAGVPCSDPVQAHYFLKENVWRHKPLHMDIRDSISYKVYLKGLCAGVHFKMDFSLWSFSDDVCLVHGDATLENLLMIEQGILAIDPGDTRGYNSVENDKGKLCQSWLTHWNTIKYKAGPVVLTDGQIETLDINYNTICSVLYHWIRIIKNAKRHAPRVSQYGREFVIPILEQALRDKRDTRSLRLRWDVGTVRRVYDTLLHAVDGCLDS